MTASEAGNAPRAVLYARVSTQEQTKGYSIRQQFEALRAWCAAEGYEVLEECADPGDSGQHLERVGLDRARDLVESRQACVIVAQDADRITREPAHRLLLDSEVERHGARLVALDDWGDDTHEGHLLRYMRGWVAKGELLKTAERTRRGLSRKIREGKVIRGKRPPMGFAYVDGGDRLVPSEPEMDAVRLIFSMIGVRGTTMGEAAEALRDRGMKPPGGGNWHRPTIRRVVLSPLYRPLTAREATESGLLSPGAASGLDPDGTYGLWTFNTKRRKKWKERGPDGEIRTRYSVEPRPREEWQAVAVDLSGSGLSRAQVDAARESIKGNTRRPASTVSERFWQLSGGIARCEVCGSALSPHTTSRARGRKAPYYRCFQRYNSGPRDCTNTKTLPAAPLEEAVWQKVRLLLEEPERVMAAYDAYVELRGRRLRGDPDREAGELSAGLEKLERRRSNLIDMGADGTIGREDLRAKLDEADEERDSLRRALREVAGRREELERLKKEREVLAGRFSAMRGMGLRHLPPRDRRAVYGALRITAHADEKGDVRITGIFDADITELLPMSWALAKAGARENDPSINRQLPSLHKGVVIAGHPRRGTSFPRARRGR